MKRKTAGIALVAALVGCSLTQTSKETEDAIPRIGGGEVLSPKRCVLRMMVVSRPQGNAALNESLWRVADEQMLDPDAMLTLQANGLRVGRVSGDLPADVQALLSSTGTQQADAQTVVIPDGDQTLLSPGTSKRATMTLFRSQNGKLVVKDYTDPTGLLRVTATYQGQDAVNLRITPEIHFGPMQQGWGVAGGATPMTPQQIILKSGQQEETFREMTTTLTLKPGQVAVIAGRHEKRGSLGGFMFGEAEAQNDRTNEKVIFVWAARSESGVIPPIQPPSGLIPFELAPEDNGKAAK